MHYCIKKKKSFSVVSKSPRWVILAHPWKLMLQIHSSPRETGWPKAVTRASRETSRGRDRLLKCSMRLHCMRRFRQMAGIRARLTELGCGHFWRWGTRTWRVPVYRLHDMMTQVIISVGKHDARMEFEPSSSVSFLCLQALALPFRQHFQRRTPSLLCHSGCGLSTHPAGRTYNTQWILREEKGRLRQPGV